MRKKDFLIAFVAMILLVSGVLWRFNERSKLNCVHIFYDQTENPTYSGGRQDAITLQGLLIFFPEFAQIIRPVESYQPGDIERCPVNFYIGSYRDNPLPDSFLQDFVHTKKNVAWIGYNVWQLRENLPTSLGLEFLGFTIDPDDRKPSFFRDILYKGATYKGGTLTTRRTSVVGSPVNEQVIVKALDLGRTQILAESKDRNSAFAIPYIVRTNNYFYVADIPFTDRQRGDRYLVFVDLLFDILGAEPQRHDLFALMKKDSN
jgi:uncharacterized protein YdaL